MSTSTSSSRRVGALLFSLFFHIAGVLGRGGKGEGGGEGGGEGEGGTIADGADTGSDIGDAASSDLDLSPELNAVFAIAIVIAVITVLQLIRGLVRFKHLISRDSELALSHNVGALFPLLLVFYMAIYIANNVLRAVHVADYGDRFFQVSTLSVWMQFTGQFSTVLLYGTFLAIIAYRQKNQLHRQESVFNLKTVLDGLLLTTMLVLGVAEDIIAGPGGPFEDFITLMNMSLAFKVLGLLASLNVAISAYKARDRLSNAGIHDKMIATTASVIGPMLLIGGIYGVIEAGIERSLTFTSVIEFGGLLVATVVIEGVISVLVVAYALFMSAPTIKPEASHDNTIGEKV